MTKTLHFKNKKDYLKWLAWNYENNRNEMQDGKNSRIYVKNKKIKVNHKRWKKEK